jgi:hypothetical protein
VLVDERLAARPEVVHVPLHVTDEVLALEDREVREGDRARERVAAEGDAVRERRLRLLEERLDRPLACDQRPERSVRARDPLRDRHHVGLDPVARAAEPVSDPPEAADHLVHDQQETVGVADLAHPLEVAFGRRDRSRRVLHRLEDHRRDRLRVLVDDDRLDLVRTLQRAARPVRAVGAAVAVGHRRPQAPGQERLELRAQRRAAVDRERAHRRPVVGAPARDELVARRLAAQAVVLARDLHRGLDRLAAPADEEDAADVHRHEARELVRELERRRRREADPVREEGQPADLLGRRLGDLGPRAVADVHAVERRERVEVAPALGVPDVAALGAVDDDRRVEVDRAREVTPEPVARYRHRVIIVRAPV